MIAIESYQRTVYRAPTRGRTFLTAKGAARSEASALIAKKYPPEKAEYENGFCYYGGFHWSSDDRLLRVHARLVRMILKRMRKAKT